MIDREVHVHFLPATVRSEQLRSATTVVIDVLRASTTIITALQNGASHVVPCETVEQARGEKTRLVDSRPILGGERGGVRIKDFDCGNSPAEYNRGTAEGRPVVFTSTNGTRALVQCSQASAIFVGAFVNVSALADQLCSSSGAIHLVCAGTDGSVTGEDVLFAGCLVWWLSRRGPATRDATPKWTLKDSARVAQAYWDQEVLLNIDLPAPADESSRPLVAALSQRIAATLRRSQGGRNLLELGFGGDIELCSQLDARNVVPRFDPEANQIRSA